MTRFFLDNHVIILGAIVFFLVVVREIKIRYLGRNLPLDAGDRLLQARANRHFYHKYDAYRMEMTVNLEKRRD